MKICTGSDFRVITLAKDDGTVLSEARAPEGLPLEERKALFLEAVRRLKGKPVGEASERLYQEVRPQ